VSAVVGSRGARADQLSPDRLAALEEERDFLLRSLADLEAERAAGDIDEADYRALSDDYTARTAEVLRAIDEHRDAVEAGRPPRSRGRIAAVIAGVAVVAVVAGILVAQASGRREPGQTITGAAPSTATQQARRCIDEQSADTAIKCYTAVLGKDPRNPTALTYLAWTVYRGSLDLPSEADREQAVDVASRLLERSVKADPDFADAYAFRAIIALRTGDVQGASDNLDRMDALDPPASVKALIAPIRDQVDKALRTTTTTTQGGG
jgi:tetratricopeptide (TPR) repeat protein